MKRPNQMDPQLPLHDYGLALQSAVSWLGDRYLLAAPVVARQPVRQAMPSFLGTRRWHRGLASEAMKEWPTRQ